MAIYRPTKDSKVWWYDFIFEGQRVRESAKTRSKTVAKDAAKARRRELEETYNGIKRRDRAKLFSVAAEEWLVIKSLTLAASSQRIERDNLRHVRPHFERRLVTDIQAKDVSRYQHARLAEGASPKTINLEVGTLRAILRRHRVWAEIQQDVRMLPTLDDVGHALTVKEEAVLLTACLKSRCRCLYVVVMLALNTGMRYSEIRLLRWRQVDFVARMLTVGKSKSPTGTGRAIPLNSRILSVLEMWAARFPGRQPAHFVFASEKYGAAGQTDTFGFTAGLVIYDKDPTRPIGDWKEAWEKAKQRAGAILSSKGEEEESEPLQCRFHDLRHTAVTRLLEAGIPYPVVASIMGWSAATAIRMSKRYGHIGNQALRAAADVLGGVENPAESLKKSPKSSEIENGFIQ
jgi:integrase